MKVISLIEPWATLIEQKQKYVETRSWKTNYRGTIYIHASLKKVNAKDPHIKELLKLIPNAKFKYGSIICKATLVDCIFMNEEFIKEIKNNKKEYMCGEYKIGRYAWILENIESIPPIKAKGSLGIWNHPNCE